MAGVRAAILVSATITAPTLVFEPHLSSTANPAAIEKHEKKRLSQMAQAGLGVFQDNCEGCHGAKAVGTPLGPSLWQKKFQHGHRVQKEFHLALTDGGDQAGGMHRGLPASELSFNEVEQVARYVREVRRIELRRE